MSVAPVERARAHWKLVVSAPQAVLIFIVRVDGHVLRPAEPEVVLRVDHLVHVVVLQNIDGRD
eukprot:17932-Eustigmatos_ZCMA.PRE.1